MIQCNTNNKQHCIQELKMNFSHILLWVAPLISHPPVLHYNGIIPGCCGFVYTCMDNVLGARTLVPYYFLSVVSTPLKKSPRGSLPAPTSIKCLATDDKTVFIGTSTGRVVTIPVDKLPQKQMLPSPKPPSPPKPHPSPPQQDTNGGSPKLRNKRSSTVSGGVAPRKPPRKGKRSKGTQTADKLPLTRVRSSESSHYGGSEENDSSEQDEDERVFLEQSAVSLHCHRDKVRTLLHVVLPRSRRELLASANGSGGCFNSMPNLSGPGYRLPLGQPLFKSLVVSIGKGHAEYSVFPPEPEQNVEDASARRERNKSFQLMLWGHRNSIP